MMNKEIDQGKSFDWGNTSNDYGKFRDIYPESLYEKLRELGIGIDNQRVLDVGTGTGVLPRAMYTSDLKFIGTDASKNQIDVAIKLANFEKKHIEFEAVSAEDLKFKDDNFDVITSVQSWHYFDEKLLIPKLRSLLKPNGQLVIIFMYWLPDEDDLVKSSESLILKYNSSWTGGGIKRIALQPRDFVGKEFKADKLITFDAEIPFTRESWLGRIRASRGIGASLSENDIERFDIEHKTLIANLRPQEFTVLHQLTVEVYK